MTSLRRRSLIGVAALIAFAAPVLAAPKADAHHCARATVYLNGSPVPVGTGSCSAPQFAHICLDGNPGLGNTYVDYVACVHAPVAQP